MKRRAVLLVGEEQAPQALTEELQRYGIEVRPQGAHSTTLGSLKLIDKEQIAVMQITHDAADYMLEVFTPEPSIYRHATLGGAIALYVQDHIYYRKRIDLRWHPQELTRSVDFTHDAADFIVDNPYYCNPEAKRNGSTSLYMAALNEGLFFRSAKNRREKNYWNPALNAGMPLTPKRDVVHEITFMAHDLGHFMIPDLIFTGTDSTHHYQVYTASRMMSEAFTMVMADMIFVDSLALSGIDYDYSKRRIYPLFKATGLSSTDLHTLLAANVAYCLRGSDASYRHLLAEAGADFALLEHFKEKYMAFFVEDYKWTAKNYQNFRANREAFEAWWADVAGLRELAGLQLESIDEFSTGLDPSRGDLIDQIFAVQSERIETLYQRPVPLLAPREERLKKAFYRYMMGQLLIFYQYEGCEAMRTTLLRVLLDHGNDWSPELVDVCRAYYEAAVDDLERRQVLTADDASTYKELYPHFEPSYAHYDEESGYYRDLKEEAERILFA